MTCIFVVNLEQTEVERASELTRDKASVFVSLVINISDISHLCTEYRRQNGAVSSRIIDRYLSQSRERFVEVLSKIWDN